MKWKRYGSSSHSGRRWILVDTKKALTRTGSLFIGLGSTVILGRLVMLAPVAAAQEVLAVLAKVDAGRAEGRVLVGAGSRVGGTASLDAADALRLVKAALMLYAASIAISAIALWSAAGYTALLGGGAFLVLASSQRRDRQAGRADARPRRRATRRPCAPDDADAGARAPAAVLSAQMGERRALARPLASNSCGGGDPGTKTCLRQKFNKNDHTQSVN